MTQMDPGVVQTFWTVAAFLVFAGIVAWAWSLGARKRFKDAEQAPFADEDARQRNDPEGDR